MSVYISGRATNAGAPRSSCLYINLVVRMHEKVIMKGLSKDFLKNGRDEQK